MKYFTGDESGLVKWIAFPPKVQEKRHKRVKKTEEEGDDKKEKEQGLQPLTGTYGKVDKEQAVQKLLWATLDNEKVLVVARKNGFIQFMSPETGAVLKQFKNESVGTEDKKGRFVGLFIHKKHICACTSTGNFSYTPLESKKTQTETVFDLGSNLEIMRCHPTLTNIFAIGGKERDLCIYDIDAIVKAKQQEAIDDINAAGPNENTSIHKKKSNRNVGLIFQAKNVKNDFLDLQQPVWIHDLQFVDKSATKVAVATHYHQFRLYDTKTARRPVTNIEVGKHPIKVLTIGTDYNHVLFADTISTVCMLDIRTGKRSAQFKGFTGAATDLVTVPYPSFDDQDTKERLVASVSLDRFMRVHETSTVYRNILDKSYLKQRLTCILVDEEYEYPVPKVKTEEEQEEEEENAMWESMEVAKDRKRKLA